MLTINSSTYDTAHVAGNRPPPPPKASACIVMAEIEDALFWPARVATPEERAECIRYINEELNKKGVQCKRTRQVRA